MVRTLYIWDQEFICGIKTFYGLGYAGSFLVNVG